MTTPRFLAVCAVLTTFLALPCRAPAEEAENTEEDARQKSDEAPATTTATTDADAPAAEPVPVKRASRGYKQHPRPAAARRDDDDAGGGGGGGGAVPRRQPQHPEDEGENTYVPEPPKGKPSPNSLTCDMPPLHHINVHIRGGNGNRMIADATPIVCSTDKGTKHERYCQETMNDDARNCCPAKPEGHPLRLTCEIVLLGKDSDGVAGPSWQYVGKAPDSGVEKREDNPFLAYAYGSGIARACSNVVKVCGEAPYKVK